ncbi:MAG: sulfur reduction protein DsrS [Gammaproteobacteria bacterium]|nr:sulfur reduction protein DsrS [Gammaproteobacteria bacterium]MCP5135903.1 sulfur reduction protein DsrS [Gammaproteobacteria bacterium]
MPLSAEDDLRINVLLANEVQAIRIDEGPMVLHALSPRGEARLKLNPNERADRYLRNVREAISGHILGSPGGYPIYIKRWTRTGQINTRLEDLLRLGEPEAVVAVVHADSLTDELARRAWWCLPTSDNARRMLARPCVAAGTMGPVLAEFLVEFLPFEEDPAHAMESVRLVLQPGLIDAATRERLWKAGQRKNALRVGFLAATPDDLPETRPAHPASSAYDARLSALSGDGNPIASRLQASFSAPGQAFLATAQAILDKPATQAVVSTLLNVMSDRFSIGAANENRELRSREIEEVHAEVDTLLTTPEGDLAEVLTEFPELRDEIAAILTLARCNEAVVTQVFAHSDAVGSVMRRQIQPLTDHLFRHLNRLQGR